MKKHGRQAVFLLEEASRELSHLEEVMYELTNISFVIEAHYAVSKHEYYEGKTHFAGFMDRKETRDYLERFQLDNHGVMPAISEEMFEYLFQETGGRLGDIIAIIKKAPNGAIDKALIDEYAENMPNRKNWSQRRESPEKMPWFLYLSEGQRGCLYDMMTSGGQLDLPPDQIKFLENLGVIKKRRNVDTWEFASRRIIRDLFPEFKEWENSFTEDDLIFLKALVGQSLEITPENIPFIKKYFEYIDLLDAEFEPLGYNDYGGAWSMDDPPVPEKARYVRFRYEHGNLLEHYVVYKRHLLTGKDDLFPSE